jgi:4-oxalocrotonate tautomerase
VPHVEIHHFPAELSEQARERLADDIVAAVVRTFGVPESAVSIGLVSVEKTQWTGRVYTPLISDRPADTTLLRKPGY